MKLIKDYYNYQITTDGKVINNKTNKIIKSSPDKDGYLKVNLYNKNKHRRVFVHRLVAQAFIPNPCNLPQVNHINGIKTDNRVENLEWVTAKQNVQHSIKMNLRKNKGACHIGEKNTNCKLKEEDVLKILRYKKKQLKIKEVYELYKNKISFSGFQQIWYGYKWKHLIDKVEG